MDDEEEVQGIDGVDTILRNIPQILTSIIVIVIAYFVWGFFNSPTGSALGEAVGDMVGLVTEMSKYWYVFVGAWALTFVGPALFGFLSDYADRRDTMTRYKLGLQAMQVQPLREQAEAANRSVVASVAAADGELREQGYTVEAARKLLHAAVSADFDAEGNVVLPANVELDTPTREALRNMRIAVCEASVDTLFMPGGDSAKVRNVRALANLRRVGVYTPSTDARIELVDLMDELSTYDDDRIFSAISEVTEPNKDTGTNMDANTQKNKMDALRNRLTGNSRRQS